MKGKLSRAFEEILGVGQGKPRASDHYKIFISPCLDILEQSNLGLWCGGDLCITVAGVADDVYLITDDPVKLQCAIDLVEDYGRKYRVSFGQNKTKIIVTGSEADVQHYKDVKMWKMDGATVEVADENEHLGLVVAGYHEEQRNVEENINRGRKSLYSLLGPAFSFQSLVNPKVQMYIFRMFTSPITLSGLSALAIRPAQCKPLVMFHRRIMRSFLHLSDRCAIPSLHFILGEITIEARLHRDVFSVFYSIWSNPNTKVHHLVKYLLTISNENSRTWSVHVRHLAEMYGLGDPLLLLEQTPPTKESWKGDVSAAITSHHEKLLREAAATNSKMEWLNVSMTGLTGKCHPIMDNIYTAREVEKLRPAIKMLAGDYYTFAAKNKQVPGCSSHCRICGDPVEDLVHVLCDCPALADPRQRILDQLTQALGEQTPDDISSKILDPVSRDNLLSDKRLLTQFVLDNDCTSYNLPSTYRYSTNDPKTIEIFRLSRDLCYTLHSKRMRLLHNLKKNTNSSSI